MTYLRSVIQVAVVSVCLVFAGCSELPKGADAEVSKAFAKAENAISKSDWDRAYVSLEGVIRSNDPEVINRLKALITKHPEIIKAAESELIRRAHFQAEYAADHEPDETKYFSNLQTELDGYKAIATSPDSYENILGEVRRIFSSTVPTVFPGKALKGGMTIQEALRVIGREPSTQSIIRPFDGPEGEFDVLEYTFFVQTKPGERTKAPIWLAFYKSQLLKIGYGSVREAEYLIYEAMLLDLARKKKIKYADGARAIAGKHLKLFGEQNAYSREYWAYLALLGEQIDGGKISETEAEYLLAKKSNEIKQKVAAFEIEKDRLQSEQSMAQLAAVRDAEVLRQGQANQSLMMMGLGMQMMQLSRPVYQPPLRMNCTTQRMGVFLQTNCQ